MDWRIHNINFGVYKVKIEKMSQFR
jgi:hypothetical protein